MREGDARWKLKARWKERERKKKERERERERVTHPAFRISARSVVLNHPFRLVKLATHSRTREWARELSNPIFRRVTYFTGGFPSLQPRGEEKEKKERRETEREREGKNSHWALPWLSFMPLTARRILRSEKERRRSEKRERRIKWGGGGRMLLPPGLKPCASRWAVNEHLDLFSNSRILDSRLARRKREIFFTASRRRWVSTPFVECDFARFSRNRFVFVLSAYGIAWCFKKSSTSLGGSPTNSLKLFRTISLKNDGG